MTGRGGALAYTSAAARALTRVLGTTDRTWMKDAACRHFTDFTEQAETDQLITCRTICPVAAACLNYALTIEADQNLNRVAHDGLVFGGATSRQRARMLRERRRNGRAA